MQNAHQARISWRFFPLVWRTAEVDHRSATGELVADALAVGDEHLKGVWQAVAGEDRRVVANLKMKMR